MAGGFALLAWQLTALHGSVADGRQEVQQLRTQLAAERDQRASLESRAFELAQRAETLAHQVDESRALAATSGQDLGASIRRAETREAALESAIAELRTELASNSHRLDDEQTGLTAVRRRLESVAPRDYTALLTPTVKISSKSDVGSGTVIYCEKKGERFISYILTAHHIVEQNYDARNPVPLDVYSFRDGQKIREETGIVVSVSPQLDLALIEVETDRPYESVAKLIAPERIAQVKLYSRVNAIGCPLGYAPTPTSGELTSKNKVLDGQSYWMINAPTIFGNSGGGIYLSDTGEMIGVLSRISAYKNLIDVAVPHMGIITSMNDVYSWLGHERYAFVLDHHLASIEAGAPRLAETTTVAPLAAEVTSGAVPAGGKVSKRD
ncbi:MAG TPA: trypsin-like peptidase domain-containing protein [Planctomycetota bacterium]|nr:trypsin-like peptidase domain-containing protein [Planctomycetota bacterium]